MSIWLITGSNTPLIEEAISKIYSNNQTIAFNKCPQKITLSEFLTNIQTCDMFSQNTGYIIQHPMWLNKASNANDSLFKTCISTITDFNVNVILVTKKIDKRSSIYKQLKKANAIEQDFPEFKDWETKKSEQWITNHCKNNGITINNDAIKLLTETFGINIAIIKQELNKCIITIHPNTTIAKNDIINTSGVATSHYASLSEEFKKGNTQKVIAIILTLLNLKEDPHKIFNQLLFQLNTLFPIYLGNKQNIPPDSIAKMLGKHPFFIKNLLQDLQKNTIKHQFSKLYIELAKIDKKIKTGHINSQQGLLLFCNVLKYQI